MITRLSGSVLEKRPTEVVVDVQGVGYQVLIPTSTYESLPERGARASLYTHLHVREDAMTLFGFATVDERAVFQMMLAVSGVGPKLALAALSAMRPAEIRAHVSAGDVGFLTRIPGVGRKTAERLVVELRDRLEKLDLAAEGPAGTAAAGVRGDALAALEALGYSRSAAEKALRAAEKRHPDEASVEALIRLALREQ